MQNVSALYNSIMSGSHHFEYKAVIAGTTYPQSSLISIRTSASVFDDFGIGQANAASLELSLIPQGTIPRIAEIKLYVRAVNDILQSEWLPKGVFFIDTRKTDDAGIMTITGYDAMLKSEVVFLKEGSWVSQSALDVVETIAADMGVSVADETLDLLEDMEYQIPFIPEMGDNGTTSREMLSLIGVMHAGNWAITDGGKLKLFVLTDIADEEDSLNIARKMEDFSSSAPFDPIDRVLLWTGEDTYVRYPDVTDEEWDAMTGRIIEAGCPYGTVAIAQNTLTVLSGFVYRPYEASNAELDPAAEVGDGIIVNGLYSILSSRVSYFDALFLSDIKAKGDDEIDHEYPYQNPVTRRFEKKISGINTSLQVLNGEIVSKISSEDAQSLIDQSLDSIRFEVSQESGTGGTTYARMTLTVGEEAYSGLILLEGNVNISGQLSADELYTTYGDMANLTVDRLRTSRRIVLYLAGNTEDDNFIDIHNEEMELIAGEYNGSATGSYLDRNGLVIYTTGYTQALNPSGVPLFWESDVEAQGVVIGSDGYPYRNGVRIFMTTTNTGHPVFVYTYDESVKARFAFIFNTQNEYYEPQLVMGAGDGQGHNIGRIHKTGNSMDIMFVDAQGQDVGARLGVNGYLDLFGLRKTVRIDFSGWNSGSFKETIDGGINTEYEVTFDSSGRPISIKDEVGHYTEVVW